MASRKRFNTLSDCRRYLASVVNQVDSGDLDPQVAGRLGYLVNILVGIIKDNDIEERLKNLEKQFENANSK